MSISKKVVESLTRNIKPDEAAKLRDSLRWTEDRKIYNHFGDHVWLKALSVDGKRVGITECCFVSDPCEHHKRLDGKGGA